MTKSTESQIPSIGHLTTLAASLKIFLSDNPNLHLGGDIDFHQERRHHLEILGFHKLPKNKQAPIGKLLSTCTGGGYTVDSVDEFENGLRLVAERSGVVTIGVDYRLAPEHHFPTQLDEYSTVVDWVQGQGGSERGISPDLVFGGGDSAGGNMTAALSLRRRDQGLKALAGQILLYPEARLPFDTPAAVENNTGYYLECNGIFSFGDHYLPKAPEETVAPSYEYGHKLQQAGVDIKWHHYPELTHGFLQLAPWSEEALKATNDTASTDLPQLNKAAMKLSNMSTYLFLTFMVSVAAMDLDPKSAAFAFKHLNITLAPDAIDTLQLHGLWVPSAAGLNGLEPMFGDSYNATLENEKFEASGLDINDLVHLGVIDDNSSMDVVGDETGIANIDVCSP
ncbi:hypothetical protein INS49_001112 [Diaporthe citri]|uniref:uncharacterized protein n=1 Tax=Diaporthe citri TaxID=83186 RepID=UPI001C7E33C0|nr:uncharacterized protein INS49_001112 [Diaporthe citri]KAG6366931.1 hypothetical protein INS49_001112 [Diaporthe citri]